MMMMTLLIEHLKTELQSAQHINNKLKYEGVTVKSSDTNIRTTERIRQEDNTK